MSYELSPQNKELINEFLAHKVEYHLVTGQTYKNYNYWLRMYAEWLEIHRAKHLIDANAEDILAYRNSLDAKRNNSIQSYFIPIKMLYKWLASPTNLNEASRVELNPFPQMMLPKGARDGGEVPTAQQIFKIRQGGRNLTLRRAVILEVLLSSGMRSKELRQIRACDINWEGRPPDLELKTPSPFVGASIDLNPHAGFQIKQKRRRTIYLSKLAAKLLKFYIKKHGIGIASLSPVFPLQRWKVGSEIRKLEFYAKLQQKQAGSSYQRQEGFLDLDVSKVDGTPEYKALLRKAQEQQKKEMNGNPFAKRLSRIEPTRRISFHPHTLRHFFSRVQYYRNWFGNRHDLLTLKELLGHSNIKQVCTYANAQLVVYSDAEWKQLMCGNGFDYQRLFYDC